MEHLEIGCLRLGGLGDTLELSMLIVAIKRKYPDSNITMFVRTTVAADLIRGRKDIKYIRVTGTNIWIIELLKICSSQEFDIVYDCRYVTRVFYKDEKRFADDKKKTDEMFQKYAPYYHTFPMRCNELGKKWTESNRRLSLTTACLIGDDNDSKIVLTEEDEKFIPLLENRKYITVHNGSDEARGSKCWATKNWVALTKILKDKGYAVIQLGRKGDDIIEGAINMVAKLTIKESTAIIKYAQFHIDTECGLVHIANAVKTRCIVLFGPTPLHFFAYKDNINIETPFHCKGCWWTSGFWFRECPRISFLSDTCMDYITPEIVMQKGVEEIEKFYLLNKST